MVWYVVSGLALLFVLALITRAGQVDKSMGYK